MSSIQHGPEEGPGPSCFVIRETGELVPLIAVDELPAGLSIVDIPKNLKLDETVGMLNLGLQRRCETSYKITQKDTKLTERDGRGSSSDKRPPTSAKSQPTRAAGKDSIPADSAAYDQTCRHWCHHGVCKWGQQCRYRHVMPMTRHKLMEVGLGDWPNWYRRANGDRFAPDLPSRTRERQRRGESDDLSRRIVNDVQVLGAGRVSPSVDDDSNNALKSLKSSVFESRARERRRKLLARDPKARRSPIRASREVARCVDDRVAKAEAKSWEDDVDSDSSTASTRENPREKIGKGSLYRGRRWSD